ncbi:MAG: protein arginine kinase [Bacillota bacterium]|jgi:protein arginine kinase
MSTNNEKILNQPFANWTKQSDKNENIVISTRLRLARNLTKEKFPQQLSGDEARNVALKIKEAVYKYEKSPLNKDHFNYYDLSVLTQVQRQVLFEKHFISRNLVNKSYGREVVINDEQNLAIMINEEDHLRMQCILPGLQLEAGWQKISELDDALNFELNFAYDSKLGYLTACPSNVGTGLRASVMLHLPALKMTNKLEILFQQLAKFGMTVRGVYGEGSKSYGSLYQISNQITIGYSETEIIRRLQKVVDEFIAQEKRARHFLMENNYKSIMDYVWWSYGILSNARMLTAKECMEQLSVMRLGVALGILKSVKIEDLNQLMIHCQPAFLVMEHGADMQAEDRDWLRAEIVRKYFNN